MRITTWNQGYWQFTKRHTEAWRHLREVIRPDIAFLQETRPPELLYGETLIFAEIHRGWGTAVYARELELKEISLEKYPARCVGAVLKTSVGREICLFSVHAPIIRGRVFPHLAEIFGEIEEKACGRSFLIGGDLNSARLAERVWPGYGHGEFFRTIDEGRFTDCRALFHPEEIQTFFRPGQKHPFQDDHIFCTNDLAGSVRSFSVENNETTRRLSDHVPVLAEIEL